MEQLLSVRIDSPEKTIWEGKAASVSGTNSQGPFDILPQHASFITIVEKTPLTVRTDNGEALKFSFDRCVIHTHKDAITIYTNI